MNVYKELRLNAKLTQQELSEKMHCSIQQIRKIETLSDLQSCSFGFVNELHIHLVIMVDNLEFIDLQKFGLGLIEIKHFD